MKKPRDNPGLFFVTPAYAGVQADWIPAFAGMTDAVYSSRPDRLSGMLLAFSAATKAALSTAFI